MIFTHSYIIHDLKHNNEHNHNAAVTCYEYKNKALSPIFFNKKLI